MGEIVEFNIGCRLCQNLVQVGKNTYTCSERVHLDDSSVFPILNGKINDEDWNICDGECYVRVPNSRFKKRSS